MMSARAHSSTTEHWAPAFGDPARASQKAFRTIMNALAEPGTVQRLDAAGARCPGFSEAMTAVALTLIDFETKVFLDGSTEAERYLRFHTGAPIVSTPGSAAFAFITEPRSLPGLAVFAHGTLDYPDASTTIVIDVQTIDTNGGWGLAGPGIDGTRRIGFSPLREGLLDELTANRAAFPLGVDILFCAGERIVSLPRSTRVTPAQGGR